MKLSEYPADETCNVTTCDNPPEYECPRCNIRLCEGDTDAPDDLELESKGCLCPLCMTLLEEI